MFLCYANLISFMEVVKAKETFPFVIQPNGRKSLGRSSFIIKLYLGFTLKNGLLIYLGGGGRKNPKQAPRCHGRA